MTLFERLYYAAENQLKDYTLLSLESSKMDNSSFLDLGCGDCEFTEKIIKVVKPGRTTVIDNSNIRLAIAKARGYYSILADLNRELPLNNSFDIIHAGNVIEHLNNTDMFVKEIRRILSPNGFAIITTNNLSSWHNILALCLGRQPLPSMVSDEIPISNNEADRNMPKHRRIFTLDGLTKLLKFHNLRIVEASGCGYYPFPAILQELFSMIDPKHSAYLLVKVVK